MDGPKEERYLSPEGGDSYSNSITDSAGTGQGVGRERADIRQTGLLLFNKNFSAASDSGRRKLPP